VITTSHHHCGLLFNHSLLNCARARSLFLFPPPLGTIQQALDDDNDGFITPGKIHRFFDLQGLNVSNNDVHDMIAKAGLTDRLLNAVGKRNLISFAVFEEFLIDCSRRDPSLTFPVAPMPPVIPDTHDAIEAAELATLLYHYNSTIRADSIWGQTKDDDFDPVWDTTQMTSTIGGSGQKEKKKKSGIRNQANRCPAGGKLLKDQYYKPIGYHFKLDGSRPESAPSGSIYAVDDARSSITR